MALSNLETLPEIEAVVRSLGVPWSVRVTWSRSARNLGRAIYWTASGKFDRLEFSKALWPHLSYEQRLQTVRHESAHALRPAGEHHSRQWRELVVSFGGSPNRLAALSPEVIRAVSKWVGQCPRVEAHKTYRKALTQKTRTRSCGQCDNKWNPTLTFTWEKLR